MADVIVAAAGTACASTTYGLSGPDGRAATRGHEYPRIALVTRSLDLDPTTPLFTEAPEPPIVFTVEGAPADRAAALAPVADVVRFPGVSVEPADMVAHLHASGARTVLVEGGPSLNGALFDADLIDEMNVTFAPALVGGPSPRLISGADERVRDLPLAHLWECEGVLLARYARG